MWFYGWGGGVSLRFKHELDEDEVGEFMNGVLSPTTLQSGPDWSDAGLRGVRPAF